MLYYYGNDYKELLNSEPIEITTAEQLKQYRANYNFVISVVEAEDLLEDALEDNKIRVVVKEPHKEPEVREIENNLSAYREIVEGEVASDTLQITGKPDILYNEDTFMITKDYENIYLTDAEAIMYGTLVVAGVNEDLEWCSLTDEQITEAIDFLKTRDYDSPEVKAKADARKEQLKKDMIYTALEKYDNDYYMVLTRGEQQALDELEEEYYNAVK